MIIAFSVQLYIFALIAALHDAAILEYLPLTATRSNTLHLPPTQFV